MYLSLYLTKLAYDNGCSTSISPEPQVFYVFRGHRNGMLVENELNTIKSFQNLIIFYSYS